MSAAKYDQPLYKGYELPYQTQRPIIVDDAIDSPETVTLRYEEEAARANGGDLNGESPTGLLPMATYKPQPAQLHAFADSPFSQYSAQSFSTQQTENATSQMNQMAYSANGTSTQYLPSQGTVNVLSWGPSTGNYGTNVLLKVSSQYDLQTMTGSSPYATILFGSHRVVAQILKGGQDSSGAWTYTISCDAPQFGATNCSSPAQVPVSLLIESTEGEELSRYDNAGTFSYHSSRAAGPDTSSGDTSPHEGLTRKCTRSPERRDSPPQCAPLRSNSPSPANSHHGLTVDPTTNTYAYPPAVAAAAAAAQAQAQAQSNFAAYPPGGHNMLGAYRSNTFADHYSRAPPALRSPHGAPGGWSNFGSQIDPMRNPVTALAHTTMARSGLTSLPQPSSGAPKLIRTSCLGSPPGNSHSGSSGGYNPYALFPAKATLKINGALESMAENWTQDEWDNKRRIVLFKKTQHGSQLQTSFRAVPITERPPNSICISCIWWAEKQECFVTSVDTIHLLEQLVAAPGRFTVEEKNRIRRNLEGFHPLTVSKAKAESEEFFKIIMAFGNPKPRNIEKDVKVFPWKILAQALKKIISKYSASPASTMLPTAPNHVLTPVSVGSSSYPILPPTPNSLSAGAVTDPVTAIGYISSSHHHNPHQHHSADPMPSPRSLSGGSSSWYGGHRGSTGSASGARPMSPGSKPATTGSAHSPATSTGLRISTLPAFDSRSSQAVSSAHSNGVSSPYGAPMHSPHLGPGYAARSWDSYAPAAPDAYSAHHSSTHHGQMYGSAGSYGDGGHRA